MSKHCTKPKRKRDEAWFKYKVLLVQDQANGQVLHKEELEFLADPGIAETSEQSNILNQSETEITSDSNIISYSQYINESQYTTVLNSSSPTQQDDLILSVIEQLKTQVVNCTKINQDNKNVNEILTAELERYKDQVRILKEQNNVDKASESCAQSLEIDNLKHILSKHLKENESLEQKQLEPKLYDGSVIQKNDAIVIRDSEETLMLEAESRSKMLQKQKDPMMFEKKVNTKPIDYAALNQLSTDFETRFVPQTELSAEQAFWSRYSVNSEKPNLSSSTTIVEVPKELLKVSMTVNECERCVTIETEIQKDFINKECYDMYVVPTGRVIVLTGRYVVPTGRVVFATGSENELGCDDSAFSVFTTNSEDVEGRPIFHRFAKTNSMKVVPSPLSGDYTSLSDHSDLDESQMYYGIKSSTSSDSNGSTFVNEVEIESNVGTPTQEPINVQDLPSFSCNSSDKYKNTSRTSCNKNGYVNKKAGHFRKDASSVSKLCFVCGSGTHLIKDCDFYKKQMANKTVGIGVGSVHSRNKGHHKNQFVPQAVFLQTGKVNIPPARPQPVPTGKLKVFAPVPTGRHNRPFPVHTDRGYSPSVSSGWWKNTARPMPHFSSPTRSYFQTYTLYVPTMYYNHMKYGRDRWATAVKPSAGCSWKTHRKGLYWVPKNNNGSHTSTY
nr:hypothetical protein [Tanacetum cinerariifolium]